MSMCLNIPSRIRDISSAYWHVCESFHVPVDSRVTVCDTNDVTTDIRLSIIVGLVRSSRVPSTVMVFPFFNVISNVGTSTLVNKSASHVLWRDVVRLGMWRAVS